MRARNDADRDATPVEMAELLDYQVDVFLWLLIGVEQVAGDEHDAHPFLQSGGYKLPEGSPQLISLSSTSVAQA